MDLLYEARTVAPGSVHLSVSSGVQPHELFLPLLGAAGEGPSQAAFGHSCWFALCLCQIYIPQHARLETGYVLTALSQAH